MLSKAFQNMPRRIIYIRNPSEGSNFRTIDGGGGTGTRPPPRGRKPKKPPLSTPSGWTMTAWGAWRSPTGAIYAATPSDWITFRPNTTSFLYSPDNYAGQVSGAEYDFTYGQQVFQEPSTLLGDLYDIMRGVAQRGNIQWAPGTPGTLIHDPNSLLGQLMQEQADAGRSDYTNFYPGKLPNQNLAGNRFDPRPWWAERTAPTITFDMTRPGPLAKLEAARRTLFPGWWGEQDPTRRPDILPGL